MKLTTLLLIIAFVQVSAKTYSQVTLKLTNAPLEKVTKAIKKQTGYLFIYNEKLVKADPITVDLNNASIEQTLDACFKNQPVTYKVVEKNIILQPKVTQPITVSKNSETLTQDPIKITGKVTDSTGLALNGATVTNVIQKKVTKTAEDGTFKISANSGDQITITYVGFKTLTITAAEGMQYQYILQEDAMKLQEVVVSNGYQRISKERATGSYDYIDEKKLNEQVSTNILDRLNGVASGVIFDSNVGRYNNPGSGLTIGRNVPITIRGLSTINGNVNPLVVVDNFPYAGDLSNINPNDVASVTILKDAAASSIWGSQAGNGVIVITTKMGRYNQKAKVSFNSNITIADKPNLFAVSQMSSSDYINIEKQKFADGLYNDFINSTYPYAFTPVIDILTKQREGKITAEQANEQINSYRNYDSRSDLEKYLYQKAVNQQYAFNINGGSSAINYYVALNYDGNADALDGKYHRINVSSKNTFKVRDNFEITTNISFTQSRSSTGKSPANIGYPYEKFVSPNGTPLIVDDQIRKSYTDTAGNGKLLNWDNIPLEDWKYNHSSTLLNSLVGDINLKYKVTKGLNATVYYQYQRQTSAYNNVSTIDSYNARNLINLYTQIDPVTGQVTNNIPLGGILTTQNNLLESQNGRAQLDYNASWNKHSISAIIGTQIGTATTSGNSSTYYGYSDNPFNYAIVDFTNQYPTYITGNYGTIPGSFQLSPSLPARTLSSYVNASYTYDDRITISGSARKDGANIFGVNTNNRWKPLWSSGISWEISKENFYPFKDILPYLKLRATYGYSGNSGGAISGLTSLSYQSPFYQYPVQTGFPFANISNYNNPDLKWETVKIENFGVDFGTRNNRISGSLEYYIKESSDLFGPSLIDVTSGIINGSITKNVAKTRGDGIDITLNTENIRGAFAWKSRAIFTYNSERVKEYYNTFPNNSYYLASGNSATPIIGQQIYSIIAYKWAGLNPNTGVPRFMLNGQPSEDYNAILNNINKSDLEFIGSSIPQITGSLENSFSFKRAMLQININYKLKYFFTRSNIINYSAIYVANTQFYPYADYAKRWQKPGDEKNTNIPAAVYPSTTASQQADVLYSNSSINVLNGDQVRLQYVNLSYNILTSVDAAKDGIKSLRVYFSAQNLGVLWRANKEGIDPDYNGIVPNPRTWSLGLNIGLR